MLILSDFNDEDQDNDPGRDKPLSFHWRARNQKWIQELGLPPAPSERHDKTRASILVETCRLGRVQRDRMISYSRRKSFYAGQQRYRGTEYAYSTVPWAVDHLESLGLLEHARAKPGWRGWQSAFKATPMLIEAVSIPMALDVTYDTLETIRLKDADKRLIEYRDTEFTEKTRWNLIPINEATRSAKIAFAPGMDNLSEIGEGIYEFTKDDGQRVLIDLHQDQYHRVFNNGRWAEGGRFYGPAWQSTPKAARNHIMIDGEATVEPDYPTLHPRLLYAKVGKQLAGDAYLIEGFERQLVKLAFNVMLNADTDGGAMAAIAKEIGGPGSFAKAKAVMEAVKQRHAPVAQYFCTGAGRWLQRSDSNMAEGVLLAALNDNIVALCIHDSFRVQERHEGRILEFMDEQFAREVRRLNPDAPSSTYVKKVPQMEEEGLRTWEPSLESLPSGASTFGEASRGPGECSTFKGDPKGDPKGLRLLFLPAKRQLDLFEPENPLPLSAGDFLAWHEGQLPASLKIGLRHVLDRQGLRQADVAKRVGISRPQFVNALQGRFGVSPPVAERIKDFIFEAALAA